jgi:hypothetical protein
VRCGSALCSACHGLRGQAVSIARQNDSYQCAGC